jgi:transposase
VQAIAPPVWYERYGKRIEDTRLPQGQAQRDAYAQIVGEDGFALLDALEAPETPEPLRELPRIATLRQTWQHHYTRTVPTGPPTHTHPVPRVRFKAKQELPPAAERLASPYDPEARYRYKRDTAWTGYMVHVSETCEPTAPHLLTQVDTTPATVHEAMCTVAIHQALVDKGLPPRDHLVDSAYVSQELLVDSRTAYDIRLRGPARPSPDWQRKVEGAYTFEQFTVDWDHRTVQCPEGKASFRWYDYTDRAGTPYSIVQFHLRDCGPCATRKRCTRGAQQAQRLHLVPRAYIEAQAEARAWAVSMEGRQQYAQRAGMEGTLSQGVRAFGLRRSRYRGVQKTHLQHIATAAAMNVDRIVAWLEERPRAKTLTSRFATLAPVCIVPAEPSLDEEPR